MKQSFFSKSFLFLGFIWICGISKAQTPAPDLDSITEDSYRRMLERQEAEHVSDSLITSQLEPVLTQPEPKEEQLWYYPVGALILVGVVLWYYRKTSKTKTTLEK